MMEILHKGMTGYDNPFTSQGENAKTGPGCCPVDLVSAPIPMTCCS
ncbi:MAG: hypothetical protein RDU76_00260 [Candidatus Edwardsbacteria bacterium]|nr:hypothetical protein [Candidatus Edwardsbacteria bacterium]